MLPILGQPFLLEGQQQEAPKRQASAALEAEGQGLPWCPGRARDKLPLDSPPHTWCP